MQIIGMIAEIAGVLKKRREIAFAYLYGSFAKGLENRESDIDIAVFLRDVRPLQNPLYESRLALEIEKVVKKREVDVKVLNGQSVLFAYQVLKYGKRIMENDRRLAVRFEAAVFTRYFDFKPFMDAYDRAQARRLLA